MIITTLITILWFLLALGVLVTFHEFGHFYVARLCGVKVIRFSVGFGKPFYSWRDRHGTEFALAALPLGGYVKMLDEREGDVAPADLPHAFTQKTVWQRIAIIAAGPIANFILAILLFWVLAIPGKDNVVPIVGDVAPASIAQQAGVISGQEIIAVDGVATPTWQLVAQELLNFIGETGNITLTLKPEGTDTTVEAELAIRQWLREADQPDPLADLGLGIYRPATEPVIAEVVPASPAEAASLQIGDRLLSADGIEMVSWTEWVDYIKARPQTPIDVVFLRDGREQHVAITPQSHSDNGKVVGRVGIAPAAPQWPPEMVRHTDYSWWQAMGAGVERTWNTSVFVLASVKKLLLGQISTKNLSGPITIAKVVGDSAARGVAHYLSVLALLSVSLGVFNLLPIPVLDGGHLFYYFIEIIKGSPVSDKAQIIGYQLGLFIVAGIMILALYNDVMRL